MVFLRYAFGLFAIFIHLKNHILKREKILIVHCFFGRKRNGYYLDIGSFHPKWISNTHLLHKHGWKGTVVDIDNYKLNLFKILRRSKVNTIGQQLRQTRKKIQH